MTDEELAKNVAAELSEDPKVDSTLINSSLTASVSLVIRDTREPPGVLSKKASALCSFTRAATREAR